MQFTAPTETNGLQTHKFKKILQVDIADSESETLVQSFHQSNVQSVVLMSPSQLVTPRMKCKDLPTKTTLLYEQQGSSNVETKTSHTRQFSSKTGQVITEHIERAETPSELSVT